MSEQKTRIDPVDRYYEPVRIVEICCNVLFWVAACLSFAVLLVDKEGHQTLYGVLQISFAVSVVLLFTLGIVLRLYWSPKAEEQRRLGFFSDAFNVPLTHEKTEGFYNNLETEPLSRLGLSLLENCFFTRAISQKMLTGERITVCIYIVLFFIAVLIRNTDLALIPIAAQAVFSEQIISKWLRLEWLSMRCNEIYARLYDLFLTSASARIRNARILEAVTAYETAKANAAIGLSSRIFRKLNPQLSTDWNNVLAALKRVPPQPNAGK